LLGTSTEAPKYRNLGGPSILGSSDTK